MPILNQNSPWDRQPNQSGKMKKIEILLILAAFTLTSCGTIFCGSKARITFTSNIEKADLTIDGLKHSNVTFPYTTKIRRGFNDTVVKAEAKDHQTETVVIEKTFNAVSVINLTNVLAWGIDAATGAMMKPEFKFYNIEFLPKEE